MHAVLNAPESRDAVEDQSRDRGAVDRSNYDSQAHEYNASVESEWRRIVEENNIMRLLGDVPGSVVVDVGCGTGRLARAARDRGARLVHALDPSAGMLDVAQAADHAPAATPGHAGDCGHCAPEVDGSTGAADTGEIRYVQCFAEDLYDDIGGVGKSSQTTGVAAASADAVVMSLVLHHLDSPERVLRALRGAHSVLRSGGRLVGANSCPPPDMPADACFEFPRAACRMPHGNVEWRELHLSLGVPAPASVVRLTLFVQRWPTLCALIEEAGFRCVERHAPRIERAFIESLSPVAAASLERYLLGLALFTATKYCSSSYAR